MVRGLEDLSHERQAERVGVVQPGEEKALGRPYSSLPVPKQGAYKKDKERDFLAGPVVIGQGGMALS